ncbi:DnaJ domain, zinc finger, CCHC-type, tetratricopeptide-like helical domain protein, partial [Tanacetum coccineum]
HAANQYIFGNLMEAFIRGLQSGRFLKELMDSLPSTLEDLIGRSESFDMMNAKRVEVEHYNSEDVEELTVIQLSPYELDHVELDCTTYAHDRYRSRRLCNSQIYCQHLHSLFPSFDYSGYTLLRYPHHNKGLAFTKRERDAHYLRGLLPPAILTQELQAMHRRAILHMRIRDYEHAYLNSKRLISIREKRTEKKNVEDLEFFRQQQPTLERLMNERKPMDLYKILGFKGSESDIEIKKAYNKAACSADEAYKFLAVSESGADGHTCKETKKTIHTNADKLFKKN